MIVVYYARVADGWDKLLETLLKNLPRALEESISKYNNPHDRSLSFLGKLLLAKLIEHFKLPLILTDLKFSESQKPYFESRFSFNISHSGDIVVCAGSMNKDAEIGIGIDIEQVTDTDISMFRDNFTYLEWTIIDNNTGSFFDTWVRKEALIKSIGSGLLEPLSSIDVSRDTLPYNNNLYYLRNISIAEGYKACVASTAPISDIAIHKIEPVN